MAILFVTLFVFAMTAAARQPPTNDYEIQDMLKSILLNYDRKLRPSYLGPPVEVVVDATIIMISNIDEVRSMYTMDMFFRQRWHDHRLKHELNDTITLIVGTKHPADIIWVPDTVFIDSVKSHMHHVTVNNHKIDITKNGSVFWGTRVTVSPGCPLNLKSYPMDKQVCPFEILSYAYTSKHVRYRWMGNPGINVTTKQTAQFVIDRYHTFEEEIEYVAGNYTILRGEFHFHRLMAFAVMQIYTPSICVVIVSWVSLWIQRGAVPARVALCITTLLTISTVWSSINANLPRVNYVKAIDIFMMASFFCVIFTLIEYAIVLNIVSVFRMIHQRKERNRLSKELKTKFDIARNSLLVDSKGDPWPLITADRVRFRHLASAMEKGENTKLKEDQSNTEESNRLADRIDFTARIFFPLFYTGFLFLYFSLYV